MIQADFAPRDAKYSHAFASERVELRAQTGARVLIERRDRLVAVVVVAVADRNNIFRRALEYESSCRRAFQQHRDATSLEIERHFIDLAPVTHVQLSMTQNRFIQRAFEAGFKMTVEKSEF